MAPGVVIDERGFVVADGYQRTAAPNVYAVGDVVAGTPQLAHVGFAEAIVAIKTILGEPAVPVDYDRVPWAIYSNPEVAFCGLTEAAAKEKGYDVVVKKDPFGGNSRAQIIGDTEGVVKIIAEKRPDGTGGQILGVHMAGPWVTEQLGAGYYAVNWEATAEEAAALIQPHPSLSETFGETLLALAGTWAARCLMSRVTDVLREHRPPRPRRRDDGVREEHVRTCARGKDWFASDSPRRPLLEARLGATVGRRVARTATRAARWRGLDHRRQLQRDACPSAGTRRNRRLARYSLVVVRGSRVRAGASQARWRDARGLRGLGQPTLARRVGRYWEDLAQPPFRT